MRAIVYDRYGGPDVLRIEDVPVEAPGQGQVRLRVRAASVNPYDFHFLRGEPWFMRAMTGLARPRLPRLGRDVAGEVVAVGPGVTDLAVGDEVFGAGYGTFAEECLATATQLVPKPAALSFDAGAALAMVGTTALQGLEAGGLARGKRVLIVGASGGIGHVAVQIARAHGATVTAACRASNAAWVKGLGASRVVDHTTPAFAESGPYDLILDMVANHPAGTMTSMLAENGTYVVIGWATMGKVLGPMPQVIGLRMRRPRGRRRIAVVETDYTRETLSALAALAGKGDLAVRIEHVGGLEDVGAAIARVVDGRSKGKTVIRPGGG